MNRDDIIRMAREAGDDWDSTLREDQEFLIRFAALVSAAEREECAKVCEELLADWPPYSAPDCAGYIRERGMK